MDEKQPLNDLDFSDVTSQDPDLQHYIEKELQISKDSTESLVEPRPIFELQWTNRVIVDGLPEVNDEKKAQSLIKFLSRLCERSKCPIDPSNINMPILDGISQKFAILTFEEEETAKSAVTNLNGVFLDKKHQLSVVSFDEFDRLMQVSDSFQEQKIYSQQELKSWLTDAQGRDQFIIRAGEKTQVFWNDIISRNPELVSNGPAGKVWTDKYVNWSTDGTFLATLHSRGVVIWAGPDFEEFGKFEHYGVVNASFSPCEKYLLTFSPKGKFCVWNVASKEEARVFAADDDKWGAYKWNFNGEYLAKMADSSIFFYQTPTMSLLEDETGQKRPIKIENLSDFSWSPTSNIVACHIRENNNKPAMIKILAIPSKDLIASRNLFEALACTFLWQSEGEFLLSIILTKQKDPKKPKKSIMEVTCVKMKNSPTSTYTINGEVISCAWQAASNRFAMIYKKDNKLAFVIFFIDSQQNIQVFGEKETAMKDLLWAPQGNQIVLHSKDKGKIMFYSTGDKGIIEIEERTYNGMTHLEWDPSGRYLTVCKTTELKTQNSQVGLGYTIFNGQGEIVFQSLMEKFYQFAWRPRPKFILPKEVHNKLLSEYEHLTKKYAEQDREFRKKVKQEKREKENEKKNEFLAILTKNREFWAKTHDERIKVTGRNDEEEAKAWVNKVVNVEEIITVKREKIIEPVV
jgi:translation initiation factor 3 subunit B